MVEAVTVCSRASRPALSPLFHGFLPLSALSCGFYGTDRLIPMPSDTTPHQPPQIYFDEKFTKACRLCATARSCSPATIPPNFHAIVSRRQATATSISRRKEVRQGDANGKHTILACQILAIHPSNPRNRRAAPNV